jgi:hypothetical protein
MPTQRAIGACLGLLYANPPGDYAGHGYADGMRIEPLG